MNHGMREMAIDDLNEFTVNPGVSHPSAEPLRRSTVWRSIQFVLEKQHLRSDPTEAGQDFLRCATRSHHTDSGLRSTAAHIDGGLQQEVRNSTSSRIRPTEHNPVAVQLVTSRTT